MSEIASAAPKASRDASGIAARSRACSLPLIGDVSSAEWADLAGRAAEPNAYYFPEWTLAANGGPRWVNRVRALTAFDRGELIGLVPVVAAAQLWRLPLPMLVNADPFRSLGTPLLDRDRPQHAAARLIQAAREAGAHALMLRLVPLEGAAAQALFDACASEGLKPRILNAHTRAVLDATRRADHLLAEILGSKKLKQLRRQRHRLAEHGEVSVEIARTPDDVARAFVTFLKVEASGWKGARRTALACDPALAARLRVTLLALAARHACEIIALRAGDDVVASGIVLRHHGRAFFFKIGMDERFARNSPGVQLTVELTRHLCADRAISSADSTAAPDHPMIDHIWPDRMAIGDILIPLKRRDPLTPVMIGAIRARELARTSALSVLKRMRGR